MTKPFLLLLVIINVIGFSCKKNNFESAAESTTSPRAVNPVPIGAVGSTVQEFSQLPNAQAEADRIKNAIPWSDYTPTGFYLLPNTSISITVEQLQGSSLPTLLIGSYSRTTERWDPRSVQLTAGANNISDQIGGMLWIRYVTSGTPNGKVKITFNSNAVRCPVYIKNQTTDWADQLATFSSAPDVLLITNNVYIQYNRQRALNTTGDVNYLLQTVDKGLDAENYISGLDNSLPIHAIPVHKILMTETNDPGTWGAATNFRTSYAPGLIDEALTPQTVLNTGWGAWHEIGHMHQQPKWYWGSALGEVTVNIYSLAAERAIGLTNTRLQRDNTWPEILSYLTSTATDKNFNSSPFGVRLGLFQQLWLAYGDNFYIQLHKKARTENPSVSTDFDKMRYLMIATCQITGHNLTNFFRKWGFKDAGGSGGNVSVESVYTEIANLNLPQPTVEPSTLTDDGRPNTGIVNGGIYKIITALNNSSVIDCNSHAPINGTAITLWADNGGGNNQKWLARQATDGSFYFKSLTDTSKVFDLTSNSAGGLLKMWTYHGGNNQKWKLQSAGAGGFTMSAVSAPSLLVDVDNGSTANGTAIKIWNANGGNAQKFKFIKLN